MLCYTKFLDALDLFHICEKCSIVAVFVLFSYVSRFTIKKSSEEFNLIDLKKKIFIDPYILPTTIVNNQPKNKNSTMEIIFNYLYSLIGFEFVLCV